MSPALTGGQVQVDDVPARHVILRAGAHLGVAGVLRVDVAALGLLGETEIIEKIIGKSVEKCGERGGKAGVFDGFP